MLDLIWAFQVRGFKNLKTVLTSENVVFESDRIDIPTLIGEIADLLLNEFCEYIFLLSLKTL